MMAGRSLILVNRFLHYLLHLVIYAAVTLYQLYEGYRNPGEEQDETGGYEKSGKLYQIHGRGQSNFYVMFQKRHFLTTFIRRVHPNTALQMNVTLLGVTETEALFGVTSHGVNIYDVKQWPFLFTAQYNLIQELLALPLSSFMQLADQLGDPQAKVIWLHGTGRCDSTLMAQVFHSLQNTVSISESFSLFSLRQQFLYKAIRAGVETSSSTSYKKLFRSTVRLMLKPTAQNTKLIVHKAPPSGSILDAPLLWEMFPSIKQVFMYRDAKPQVLSLQRTIGEENIIFWLTSLANRLPILKHIARYFQIYPQSLIDNTCDDQEHTDWLFSDDRLSTISSMGGLVLGWAALCHHYRQATQTVPESCLSAFKFEHLQTNKEDYLSQFMRFCEVDLTKEEWSEVTRVFESDSQQGSHVRRELTDSVNVELTVERVAEAELILKFFRLPKFGDTMNLERTALWEQDQLTTIHTD